MNLYWGLASPIWSYSGGETAYLKDSTGIEVDSFTSVQPTATPPPADIQIIHLLYDPPGDDLEGEWVEIWNSGARSMDVTDWTVQDAEGHTFTFPAFSLGAGAPRVCVWTKGGTDTAVDLYWGLASPVWDNEGDTAYLRDADGYLIDEYSYQGD